MKKALQWLYSCGKDKKLVVTKQKTKIYTGASEFALKVGENSPDKEGKYNKEFANNFISLKVINGGS